MAALIVVAAVDKPPAPRRHGSSDDDGEAQNSTPCATAPPAPPERVTVFATRCSVRSCDECRALAREHARRARLLADPTDGAHRAAAAAALRRTRDAFASRDGLLVSMSEGPTDLTAANSRGDSTHVHVCGTARAPIADAPAQCDGTRAASVLRWDLPACPAMMGNRALPAGWLFDAATRDAHARLPGMTGDCGCGWSDLERGPKPSPRACDGSADAADAAAAALVACENATGAAHVDQVLCLATTWRGMMRRQRSLYYAPRDDDGEFDAGDDERAAPCREALRRRLEHNQVSIRVPRGLAWRGVDAIAYVAGNLSGQDAAGATSGYIEALRLAVAFAELEVPRNDTAAPPWARIPRGNATPPFLEISVCDCSFGGGRRCARRACVGDGIVRALSPEQMREIYIDCATCCGRARPRQPH